MRRWVKGLLFTGIGFLIAGIIVLFIAFAVNGFSWKNTLLPGHSKREAATNNIEENINDEFLNIHVEVGSPDIKLEKSEDGICHITYKYRGEDPHLVIGVNGDTLEIKQLDSETNFDWKHPDQWLEHFYNQVRWGFNDEIGEIVISLPEKEYDTLDISTASGDIESVQPISCSEANLSTASGEMNLENIKGKSSLNLASASGDIDIKNAEGFEMINIVSASGELEVVNASAASEMNATTTSGEMTLNQVSVSGKAELHSTSGRISLIKTEFQEGKAETTSGEIYLEYAQAEKLFLKTTSGDILGKIDADINVHGTTTSGDYSAPSGTKGDWRTETTSGDVRLAY